MNGLEGRRVLVTGATGFIGGRLVEKLVRSEGAQVRALVSSYSRCARLARFPVKLVVGDIRDASAVKAAAEGVEVIFHCAYGSRGNSEERRRVNVDGTAAVVKGAMAAGSRLVQLSTQMVYGVPAEGVLDEESPRRRSGSSYADSKLEAEELVFSAVSRGLKATVLQPTAVYGPYAPVWTVGVLERMKAGRVPLVESGDGVCNAVYVDDVVDAALAAALSDSAVGEAFLVSAAEPVTWREFLGAYEEMLGIPSTVPVGPEQVQRQRRQSRWLPNELADAILEDGNLRNRLADTVEGRLARKALAPLLARLRKKPGPTGSPELERLRRIRESEERQRPVHSIGEDEYAFYASRARVSIEKARRVLGYRPAFDLDRGMALTQAWARWAGLVPQTSMSPTPATGAR